MEALTQHGWSSVTLSNRSTPSKATTTSSRYVPSSWAISYVELSADLKAITGLDSISLQPNSGAQGELAGLRCIRSYHASQGQSHRNVCLIPVSATAPTPPRQHGRNEIIPIKCDSKGNLDMEDLEKKAVQNKDKLAAIMVTYPSTFGSLRRGSGGYVISFMRMEAGVYGWSEHECTD